MRCYEIIKLIPDFFATSDFLLQAETLASQALQEHVVLFFYSIGMKNYLQGLKIIP